MEDAIKMEKALKEMASQVAAIGAKRIDALIMGYGVDIPPADPVSSSIMGYPVIRSEHVPDDAIYTIEKRPSLKFTPDLKIGYERKSELFFIKSTMRIESLPLFYGDYVGLADRFEIKLFNWPRYVAFSILIISLIVIMLLVAR